MRTVLFIASVLSVLSFGADALVVSGGDSSAAARADANAYAMGLHPTLSSSQAYASAQASAFSRSYSQPIFDDDDDCDDDDDHIEYHPYHDHDHRHHDHRDHDHMRQRCGCNIGVGGEYASFVDAHGIVTYYPEAFKVIKHDGNNDKCHSSPPKPPVHNKCDAPPLPPYHPPHNKYDVPPLPPRPERQLKCPDLSKCAFMRNGGLSKPVYSNQGQSGLLCVYSNDNQNTCSFSSQGSFCYIKGIYYGPDKTRCDDYGNCSVDCPVIGL